VSFPWSRTDNLTQERFRLDEQFLAECAAPNGRASLLHLLPVNGSSIAANS
jgi:hypothetical protein